MNAKNIYYLTEPSRKNQPVYDIDGNLLGHYTGYMSRATANHAGTIEIQPSGILSNYPPSDTRMGYSNIWVYGDAVFIPGFGFKFVGDFTIS